MDHFDENEMHSECYLHLLWSTKNQKPFISQSTAKHLYHFFSDQAIENQCFIIAINGTEDHIQMVIKFNPNISADQMVKDLKMATAIWMRMHFCKDFDWQEGYCAFTLGFEDVAAFSNTICSPLKPFIEEVYPILDSNDIPYEKADVLE